MTHVTIVWPVLLAARRPRVDVEVILVTAERLPIRYQTPVSASWSRSPPMLHVHSLLLCWALVGLTEATEGEAAGRTAHGPTLPNQQFREGADLPTGWKLSGGQGRWVDRDLLEVSGSGDDSSHWRSEPFALEPGALYRLRFRARTVRGSGTVIAGPSYANRDYRGLGSEWQFREFVFRVPDVAPLTSLRLGQWHHTGTVQFDAVELTQVYAVHRRIGETLLGDGESIRDGRYEFRATFRHLASNYHRPLDGATASFNTDRWVFGGGDHVTYRLGTRGRQMRSASVRFAVNYHVRGSCLAEVRGARGGAWYPVAEVDGIGEGQGIVPEELFPAPEILLRLRALSPESSFQVDRIELEAAVDEAAFRGQGTTRFATLEAAIPGLRLDRVGLADDEAVAVLSLQAANERSTPLEARVQTTVLPPGESRCRLSNSTLRLGAGEHRELSMAWVPHRPGTATFDVLLEDAAERRTRLRVDFSVHEYHRTDYGWRLAGVPDDSVVVWWCEAGWKVPPNRPPPSPEQVAASAELAAARGDFEAVQLVVRPQRELERLSASTSELRGPGGASIPASRVQVLRVAYHQVRHPTDPTGLAGPWPDALPPLSAPVDVAGGENQPLWLLVEVPRDALAGDYTGTVSLRAASSWAADVKVRLHVWDFTLPRQNHLETAFGLSAQEIFRYHGLRTPEDRRTVVALYHRSFSEHRISPYDPAPLDPVSVRFVPDGDPQRAELDFAAFDAAVSRAVEELGFTSFRLPIQGMGGGTFHSRREPRLGGFGVDSPRYHALFADYVGQIERHLGERGWLDKAYIYWFDEPEAKDYEFVADGMRRLRRYAPGLRRFLTEEPREELAGLVDIWCPLSANYEREEAEKHRRAGEKIWWYVCTGPKAPYCTLFIDHAATELRVWLWQTWQREISGVLVWRANYWTSSAAFPGKAQNPYEDPMGYVSGYSTPRGARRFWGNGDGRFIYPPESAAVPGLLGDRPIIEPPVSSIRWEMLREGIEDYEYLWLLRSLLQESAPRLDPAVRDRMRSLLDVPAAITSDLTTFTTDPRPILDRRAEVAAAIEHLSGQD